jgi:hypothetical protein
MESFSQAHQDKFVLFATNHKKNGWFVEIGSNDPIKTNNTYLLENKYNWKGLMVEYDSNFLPLYNQYRPNSFYEINDARNVDYLSLLHQYNFPLNIDYLQIDLDVNNRSTLDVIEKFDKTIFDSFTFTCMTIEHDIYSGDFFETRKKSREILESRGYILLFPDVSVWWENKYQPFEDWYVHPNFASHTLPFLQKESKTSTQILNLI